MRVARLVALNVLTPGPNSCVDRPGVMALVSVEAHYLLSRQEEEGVLSKSLFERSKGGDSYYLTAFAGIVAVRIVESCSSKG